MRRSINHQNPQRITNANPTTPIKIIGFLSMLIGSTRHPNTEVSSFLPRPGLPSRVSRTPSRSPMILPRLHHPQLHACCLIVTRPPYSTRPLPTLFISTAPLLFTSTPYGAKSLSRQAMCIRYAVEAKAGVAASAEEDK